MAFIGASKPFIVAAGAIAGMLGLGYVAARNRPASSAGVPVSQQLLGVVATGSWCPQTAVSDVF